MKLVGFATFKVYVANSTCALHPFRHWNSSNTKFMPITPLHFVIIILLAVKADAYPAIGDILPVPDMYFSSSVIKWL